MHVTNRQAETLIALLILALGALYFFSFSLSSPVNGLGQGPKELFEQDSRYILDSLIDGGPYRFNPQHHLLYHVIVERGYALVRPFVRQGPDSVYRFLKVFTLLTGLAFLFSLSRLLKELGLSPLPRAGVIVLTGVSVSAWFNFAGFETHSLPLAATVLYILALLRITRKSTFGGREWCLLVGSLAFAVLCRVDLWRLVALSGLLLVAPSLRARRARLAAALATVILLGAAGYVALAKAYFRVPWTQVPSVLAQRMERPSLQKGLMKLDHFKPGPFLRMGRAACVYALAAPVGEQDFRSPLGGMLRRPLSAATLAAVAVVWLAILLAAPGALKRRDLFQGMLWINWVAALVFYTWFDPDEPFLWLLEFLPFFIALLADRVKESGWTAWVVYAVAAVIFAHNAVFFYLPYR